MNRNENIEEAIGKLIERMNDETDPDKIREYADSIAKLRNAVSQDDKVIYEAEAKNEELEQAKEQLKQTKKDGKWDKALRTVSAVISIAGFGMLFAKETKGYIEAPKTTQEWFNGIRKIK